MLHVGVCNVTVEQLAIARSIVEIATVQSPFNLPDTSRTDLLTECEAHGMGFMPYRPLEGGTLAEPGGPVASAAERHGATPGQVALAWLLSRSPVIPSPARPRSPTSKRMSLLLRCASTTERCTRSAALRARHNLRTEAPGGVGSDLRRLVRLRQWLGLRRRRPT